jgi:predicted MPP superfamily phosphohydrolase
MAKNIFKYFLKGSILFILNAITFPVQFLFPAKLAIDKLDILDPYLPPDLENLRIVQLSDIHWDDHPRTSKKLFEQVISAVNKLEPDLILLTGDYVNYDPEPIKAFSSGFLKKLQSKHGVYAVLGIKSDT